MEPSSAKLHVLGVDESDDHALLGEIESILGQEMLRRSVVGCRKDGTSTSQGEEQNETTCKNCALE